MWAQDGGLQIDDEQTGFGGEIGVVLHVLRSWYGRSSTRRRGRPCMHSLVQSVIRHLLLGRLVHQNLNHEGGTRSHTVSRVTRMNTPPVLSCSGTGDEIRSDPR